MNEAVITDLGNDETREAAFSQAVETTPSRQPP